MDDHRLYGNVSELAREMAVLGNKIENLTTTVLTSLKDSKDQDARIDALERSRTQIITVFSVALFCITGTTAFSLWTLDQHIDNRFNDRLQETDLRYLLCVKYKEGRQIPVNELPVLCQ